MPVSRHEEELLPVESEDEELSLSDHEDSDREDYEEYRRAYKSWK